MGVSRPPDSPAAASTGASGSAASPSLTARRRGILLAAGLTFAAVILLGGYGAHWHWTGISGRTVTLWDWLQLLLLPVTVAVLPIWASRDALLERRVKTAALAVMVAFVPVVLAGYLIPWRWTGFAGNTLWDWLNLVALPVAVALIPWGRELRRDWRMRHTTISVVLAVIATVIVVCGYVAGWTWTGFAGNTLWNWLHLLLLPLLIPMVIVPAVRPLAQSRMIPAAGPDPGEAGREPPAPAPPLASAGQSSPSARQ